MEELAPSDAYEDGDSPEKDFEVVEGRAPLPKVPCRIRKKEERITRNIMTRFELVRVLAERAKQIQQRRPVIRSVYREVAIQQLAARWDLKPKLVEGMVDRALSEGTRLLIKELRDSLAPDLTNEVVKELSSQYNLDPDIIRPVLNNAIGRQYWKLRNEIYNELVQQGHIQSQKRPEVLKEPLYLTPKDVARLELARKVIPINIRRQLPDNTCDIWNANELRPTTL